MLKKLLLSLSVFAVLFAILEIRQRWNDAADSAERSEKPYSVRGETVDGRSVSDRGGAIALRHHPYLVYRTAPDQRTAGVTVNAQGFRGRDWTREKPAGTRRVAVLGGSVAFGQGASGDDATFCARLEASLRADGLRAEVMNAGVIGYGSTQELIQLATVVLDYAPDVVVLVDGWNDFYIGATLAETEPAIVHPTFLDFDRALARSTEHARNLFRASAYVRRMEAKLSRNRSREGRFGTFHDNLARTLPIYRRNVSRMCKLATAHGSRVVVVAQPELYRRGGDIPAAERVLRERFDTSGYGAAGRAQYPSFVEAAADVARAEGALFLDATTIFDDVADAVFVDFVHLNDRGNAILAERLAPLVTRALGSP